MKNCKGKKEIFDNAYKNHTLSLRILSSYNSLNFDDNELVTLKMTDVLGKTVFNVEADMRSQRQIRMETVDLQKGLYILVAESKSKRAYGKVFIQR